MAFFQPDKDKQKKKLIEKVFKAARSGYVHIVKTALEAGMDIETRDADGRTLLHVAALHEKSDLMSFLLGKKANPDTKDTKGNGILHNMVLEYTEPFYSARRYRHEYLRQAKTLQQHGMDINLKNASQDTAFHVAIERKHDRFLYILMEMKADPCIKNAENLTAAGHAMKVFRSYANKINEYEDTYNIPSLPIEAAPAEASSDPVAEVKAEAASSVPAATGAPVSGWHVTDEDEIAKVSVKTSIGYKLTEIFNFETRVYTRLSQNLQSGAESQMVREFSEFSDHAILERAAFEYEQRTGKPPEDRNLSKPKRSL